MRVTRVPSVALLFAVLISSCTSEDSTAPPSPQGTEAEASPDEPAGALKEIECHRADEHTFRAGDRCWRLVSDSKNPVSVTTRVGPPDPEQMTQAAGLAEGRSFIYLQAEAMPLCRLTEPVCGKPSQALHVVARVSDANGSMISAVSIEDPPYPVTVGVAPGMYGIELEAGEDVRCPRTINVEAPPGQVLFVNVSCLL